jgi:hypothetical protein
VVSSCEPGLRRLASPCRFRCAVAVDGTQRCHRVVVSLLGVGVPISNRRGALEASAFVVYDALGDEAPCQRVRVAGERPDALAPVAVSSITTSKTVTTSFVPSSTPPLRRSRETGRIP